MTELGEPLEIHEVDAAPAPIPEPIEIPDDADALPEKKEEVPA